MDDRLRQLWPLGAEAAIFDFDGTLADTAFVWHEVDVAFLERRGLPFDDEYPRRLSTLGFAEGALYTIEHYGLRESAEDICREWTETSRRLYREKVRLRPGAERYLRALGDSGIRCALATVNNADVLGALEHVDIASLFHTCVYSVDVSRGKDHPDIFLEAARRLDADPKRCMVFEDIPSAAHSAHDAGMTVCGVRANDPTQQVQELKDEADLWLESWLDIAL